MLDRLAVFETKNIHDRLAAVARLADEMAVNHDQIAFGDDSFEIKSGGRVRLREPFDETDKSNAGFCFPRQDTSCPSAEPRSTY